MHSKQLSLVNDPRDCYLITYASSPETVDALEELAIIQIDEWHLVYIALLNLRAGLTDIPCDNFIAQLDQDMENSLDTKNEWESDSKIATFYLGHRDQLVNSLYTAWYSIENQLIIYRNMPFCTDPNMVIYNVELSPNTAAIYATCGSPTPPISDMG